MITPEYVVLNNLKFYRYIQWYLFITSLLTGFLILIIEFIFQIVDLAITDLTITREREEVVDFTSAFMMTGNIYKNENSQSPYCI